jgi:hypothetical protein
MFIKKSKFKDCTEGNGTFSAITLPPPEVKTSHKGKVIGASRGKFARPHMEVERNIMTRRILESKPSFRQMRAL